MKIAIMQPYIFPYIGYYQLINSVDKFVFYDDVNFVNSGWVNRNKIIVNNKEFLFTVPTNCSQNKKIEEIIFSKDYDKWKIKFLSTIKQSYGKKKYFKDIYKIVDNTLNESVDLNSLCKNSILNTLKYLEVDKDIIFSSKIYENNFLRSSERIIDICKKEKCDSYINTIGGIELYSKEHFIDQGIKLNFISPEDPLNYLSIIDIIANRGKETKNYLDRYKII